MEVEYEKRYPAVMPDRMVLRLLRDGQYRVDLETGTFYNARGVAVTPWKDEFGYLWVRLYFEGRRRGIALAKLVWMAGTMRIVPKGFEIHHWDEITSNNAFVNLYCLHSVDHRKLHRQRGVEDIPF